MFRKEYRYQVDLHFDYAMAARNALIGGTILVGAAETAGLAFAALSSFSFAGMGFV